MVKIIGVRFRNAGKVYYFSPESLEMKVGDSVIVETARGIECGRVVLPPSEVEETEIVQPLKSVMRVATPEDVAHAAENRKKAKEAFFICKQRIRKHNLDMKLIDAEYTFDNKKALFYFTADGRVDFRELIKDLASVFKTRIELRQIGVRDETKLLGGYGICGKPLCCASYLSDFAPVSIKMAKEQNLSLNPTKISGVCGRLMCCLKNEEETYEYLNRKMPNIGDTVKAPDGTTGEIISVDILKQEVRVLVETEDDDKEIQKYAADDLLVMARRRKGRGKKPVAEMTEIESKIAGEVKEQLEKGGKARSEKRAEKLQAEMPSDDEKEAMDFSFLNQTSEEAESYSYDAENPDAVQADGFAAEESPEDADGKRPQAKGGEGKERSSRNNRDRRRNRDHRKANGNPEGSVNEGAEAENADAAQAEKGNRSRGRRDQHQRNRKDANTNKNGQNASHRDQQDKDGKKEQGKRENRNHEEKNRENKAGEENREQKNANRKDRSRDGSGNRRNHGRDRRNKDRMPKEQGKENNAENK